MRRIESVWPGVERVDAAYEYKKSAFFFEGTFSSWSIKRHFLPKQKLQLHFWELSNIFSHHRESVLGGQKNHCHVWLSQTSQRLWLPFICHQGGCCCPCVIQRENPLLCEEQILEVRFVTSLDPNADRYHALMNISYHSYSYNERRGRMDGGYPRFIYKDLPGVGFRVDAAFQNRGRCYSKVSPSAGAL